MSTRASRKKAKARGQSMASGANGYLPMSVPRSFDFGATMGFPKKLRVRHRYVTSADAPTVTPFALIQLSCNGMYDPSLSIFGGQPMYFDQCSAIYNHYTVFASRIIFEVLASGNVPGIVAGYIAPATSSLPTTYQQLAEQPGAIQKVVPSASGVGHVRLQLNWNAKDYFGGDIYDNDNLQGTAAANPTEQSYFTLGAGFSGASSEWEGRVQITVEYDAVWDEPRTMTIS